MRVPLVRRQTCRVAGGNKKKIADGFSFRSYGNTPNSVLEEPLQPEVEGLENDHVELVSHFKLNLSHFLRERRERPSGSKRGPQTNGHTVS